MIITKEEIGLKLLEGKFLMCNTWVHKKLLHIQNSWKKSQGDPYWKNLIENVFEVPRLRNIYCFDSMDEMMLEGNAALFYTKKKWLKKKSSV